MVEPAKISRRSLFGGVAALVAAPAIVRVSSLMPVGIPPVMFYTSYHPGYAAWMVRAESTDGWFYEVLCDAEFRDAPATRKLLVRAIERARVNG